MEGGMSRFSGVATLHRSDTARGSRGGISVLTSLPSLRHAVGNGVGFPAVRRACKRTKTAQRQRVLSVRGVNEVSKLVTIRIGIMVALDGF